MPSLFDSGVNIGPSQITKYLQGIINDMKPEEEIKVDGLIGPKTSEALAEVLGTEDGEDRFKELFTDKLKRHYDDLVEDNPSQKIYHKGWLNRAETWERKKSSTE